MARVQLPESRLRARRHRQRMRLALFCGGGVLALVVLLVGVTYLPFLQIRDVAVSGTETIATSTVANFVQKEISGRYLLVLPKRNIFLYPKRTIARDLLARFPELRAAVVHAANFHTLAAEVVERKPKALWCGTGPNLGNCSYVDEDGVVYAPAKEPLTEVRYVGPVKDSPVSDTALQFLTLEQFQALTAVVDALSQSQAQTPIERVVVDSVGDARAYFSNGFELIFSSKKAMHVTNF